jgi:hypothetical protein
VELLFVIPEVIYAGAAAWPVLGSISGFAPRGGVNQTAFVRLNDDVLNQLREAELTPFLSISQVKFSLPSAAYLF